MSKTAKVLQVLTGKAVVFGPKGKASAIRKTPAAAPLTVAESGLDGDEHGDKVRHGGPEKAVHLYPYEHYAAWIRDFPELESQLDGPGSFGENLSTIGLVEADVCIGDVYRIGGTALQVSQTRNPCWRLNVRFNDQRMSRRMQDTARVGWHHRVMETGQIAVGNDMILSDRPNPDWPLTRMIDLLYTDTLNYSALEELAELPYLAEQSRDYARGRLKSRKVEAWESRLQVPG